MERKKDRAEQDSFDRVIGETTAQVRDVIAALIEHRQRLRDEELARLDAETATLIDDLERLDRRKLVEELTAFKEILALHRRLLDEP